MNKGGQMGLRQVVALSDAERAMKIHEVILQAQKGELRWYQAADILGISDRHLRRLRWRFKVDPKGLFRIRLPSARRLDDKIVQHILSLYRTEYTGYNVAHFVEELHETHHIQVSYTCIKDLLQRHDLVPKHKKRGQYRRRRERRPIPGMLLHLDGSQHAWFKHDADEKQCLIAVVDDADGRCLAAEFFKEEGTKEVLTVIKQVVDKLGTFVALYTDRASHFAYTPVANGPYDPNVKTQVEQVLDELGIELIRAYSPQARGRGERAWRTMQGRLPQELMKEKITSYDDANKYLRRVFIPKYNRSFSVKPAEEGSAFIRLVGVDTRRIFSERHERKVNKDNTISYFNRVLQLPKNNRTTSWAHRKVEIRERLDGSLDVLAGKQLISHFPKLDENDNVVKLLVRPEVDIPLVNGTGHSN
jgi:hypothetical protein